MDFPSVICVVGVVLVLSVSLGSAGDIVHQDENTPMRPGCNNKFVLVKVATWINDVEDTVYVGVGARFGPTLESKERRANHTKVALADPPDCCSPPKNNLTGEVILVHRGNCSFTNKANIADSANASAILIINNRTGICIYIFCFFVTVFELVVHLTVLAQSKTPQPVCYLFSC